MAHLRGGGEYGEAWHRAGMLGRQAERRSTTSSRRPSGSSAEGHAAPERLAILGGSNGGLLVGAALTQRPELFRAVVCQVPLLDMVRYHRFRIARLWIPEYGSPEDPEAFRWLLAYSPYHHVRDGTPYPAVLLTAGESDSRVDPMHARKMAARLQAATSSGRPVLLRVERRAGHGQGKPTSQGRAGMDRRVGVPALRAGDGVSGRLLLAAALTAAEPAPRGHVVAGLIARDEETRRAIAATEGARLPRRARLDLLVTKSRYRLDVRRGETLVKVYPVAFGGDPVGRKTRAGDGATPEGRYVLMPHHASPGFGPCFYITYPNEEDARRERAEGRLDTAALQRISSALRHGRRPPSDTPLGGLILLHGTRLRSLPALTATNWTDGCIAMENADVDELLAAFSPNDRPVLTIVP